MEHRISYREMDGILKQLEEDYVEALRANDSSTLEDFVEQFLYDSWEYNEKNIDNIKLVFSRYAEGDIKVKTFGGAFNEMVDHLQDKMKELDTEGYYPVIQSGEGGSSLVAFVDGLIIQYYTGAYDMEKLNKKTPFFKKMMLHMLETKA